MDIVWTFGDSYTESFREDIEWSNRYIKWKGYIPKVYGEIVSEKLGMHLNNFGKGGTNNYTIFQNICDNIWNINANDIVIISWTQQHRFRLANSNNKWEDFYNDSEHYTQKLKNCEFISTETIRQIIFNRLNSIYLQEIRSWEEIIRKALPDTKLVFWSPFDDIELGEMRFKMDIITNETDFFIIDPHFSETGQQQLAFLLMDRLGIQNDKSLC